MSETSALVRRDQSSVDLYNFEPASLDEAKEFAKQIVASRLFSKLKTPEAAFVVMMMCRDLKIGFMAGLKGIAIFEAGGELKSALESKLMAALIRRDPRCEYLKCTHDPTDPETTDKTFARWESKQRGKEPEKASFTMKQAEALGLASKDNYKKQPEQMLVWRALSRLANREWSDVTLGLPTIEEAYEEVELERAKQVAGTVTDVEPSSSAAVVREALKKQGVDVGTAKDAVKEARTANPPPAEPKKAARNESKKEEPKDAPIKIAEGTPAARDLYKELSKRQADFLLQIGPERAKAAWFHESGVGRISDVVEEAALAEKLELAKYLERRYLVATQVNLIRQQWGETTGEVPIFVDRPELHALDRLEQMLDADTAKLARAQEAKAKAAMTTSDPDLPLEPGSNG